MSSIKRISIIMWREFLAIAGKKTFIVTTILIPLIGIACMGLPFLMSKINTSETQTVAVMDESGRYGAAITSNDDFRFHDISPIGAEGLKEFYDQQENLYAIVVIPAGIDSTCNVNIISRNAVRTGLQQHVAQCLDDTITQARIASYGIPQLDKIMEDSRADVQVNCIKWEEDGSESQSNADIASFIGLMLAFLTYMFVMMYGAMILTSVSEEKTNRIVEVMVSCCRPIELLVGKIVGVGLVGLAQIAIWVALLGVASAALGFGSIASGDPSMMMQASGANAMLDGMDDETLATFMQSVASIDIAGIVVCFILYFLGGYLLYGSLFAAAGSTVDQPNESSQVTVPLMMFLVFALWAGIACIDNPDGQLAWWCSVIPFTSPVVMMVRLPYDVALWEVVLSIVVLYASAFGIAALAAKIYRKGILLYGKKFSLKDILTLLK